MLLIAVFSQYFFGLTISITSAFLVMLVLVQRGRGGGLTGALGGAGGQSAFGTKAGDLFTRITVGVAAVWIILCAAAVFFLKDRDLPDTGANNLDNVTIESPLDSGAAAAAITPTNNAPSAPAIGEPQPATAEPSEPAAATDDSSADAGATTPAEPAP